MERFFFIGRQINEIEIKELLLHRYHSLDFIKGMDTEEFTDFLICAINKENEEQTRDAYNAMLPWLMLAGKYMDFETFQNKMNGGDIDMRPSEEILAESEAIRERFEREKENGS